MGPYAKSLNDAAGLMSGTVTPKEFSGIKSKQLHDQFNSPEGMMNFVPFGGLTAWHGSPHKFDKFRMDKIGTGEGAQAFGHGLYFAENPEVAKSYMAAGQSVIPQEVKYQGRNADQWYQHFYRRMERNPNDETAKAGAYFWERVASRQHPQAAKQNALDEGAEWPALRKYAESIDLGKFGGIPATNLYKADIADSAIPKMLDWDKPIKGQPINVAPLVEQLKTLKVGQRDSFGQPGVLFPSERAALDNGSLKGGDLYNIYRREFGGPQMSGAAASEAFKALGIPGIRYLDAGSRGKGGTSNFVLFDEDLVKILERQ